MKVAIVIPARNEEGTIGEVLERLNCPEDCSVIVVDDGSEDSTAAIVRDFEKNGAVRLLQHEEPQGYGAALLTGFRQAIEEGADAVVTLDSDLQHPPELVGRLMEPLDRMDIVTGSRYHAESEQLSEPPEERRSINKRITGLVNRLTGLSLTDAFCGFRAYRTDALKRMTLTEKGYGMAVQVWLQAFKQGLRVAEVPVPLIYPDLTRSFGHGLDDPDARFGYYSDIISRELSS